MLRYANYGQFSSMIKATHKLQRLISKHSLANFAWLNYLLRRMIPQSIIFILMISLANPSFSLRQDQYEKLWIRADHSSLNYKTGINVYEGNVILDQGTSHLKADRLITKTNKKHQIQEAIAYGLTSQAEYWTLPSQQEKIIHATAKIIKFYPIENHIVLEQQAYLKQGENSFQGEQVIYNKQSETITVPALSQSRAVLIYHPEN